jgi:hypothetical protein
MDRIIGLPPWICLTGIGHDPPGSLSTGGTTVLHGKTVTVGRAGDAGGMLSWEQAGDKRLSQSLEVELPGGILPLITVPRTQKGQSQSEGGARDRG